MFITAAGKETYMTRWLASPWQYGIALCSLILALALAAALPVQAQSISIASGNKQTAVVGTTLPNPLVAKVKSALGTAQAGVTVVFKVAGGGGTLSQLSAVT